MASKKAEIEASALTLFAERGIRGTTVRDIADRAGITEGAIYRHFRGKDDLAHALFVESMESLLGKLTEAGEDLSRASEKLRAVIRAFFQFAFEHPQAFGYVVMGHEIELGKLEPEKRKPKDVFVDAIAEGMEAGEFCPRDPNLAAALVIGMATRVIFFVRQGLTPVSPEEAAEEVCRAALTVLTEDKR